MTQQRIVEWLKMLGHEPVQEEPPDGAAWFLQVSIGDWTTVIAGEESDPSVIQLQRAVSVAPNHRTALSELTSGARRQLRFEITLDLLRSGLDFEIESSEEGALEGFRVLHRRFSEFDDINSFEEALRRLHKTAMVTVLRIRNAIGDA